MAQPPRRRSRRSRWRRAYSEPCPPTPTRPGRHHGLAAEEQYRPYLHFSPERNWMNDPNGLVYEDGTWHLFFQHNPHGTRWGNMSWGHATTTDLVHWEEQPARDPADVRRRAASRSRTSSRARSSSTSRTRAASAPPTTRPWWRSTRARTPRRIRPTPAPRRSRSPTASTTGRPGRSTTGNPVLDRGSANFRDPKVFRYDDPATGESYWVMVAVEALDHKVVLYRSDDLKTWTHLSDFGPANATGGIWECPDLFPLAVDGDPENTKWVLVVNLNPGSVAGGSGGQYFVGEFDGTTFTSESTVNGRPLPAGDVFAGFDGGDYEGWTVANEPGNSKNGPWADFARVRHPPGPEPGHGFVGAGLVNGFTDGDWPVGTPRVADVHDRPTTTSTCSSAAATTRTSTAPQLGNEPPPGTSSSTASSSPTAHPRRRGLAGHGRLRDRAVAQPVDRGRRLLPRRQAAEHLGGRPEGRRQHRRPHVARVHDRDGEDHLSFLLGGGKRTDGTLEVRLVVDGEVVRTPPAPRRASSTGSRGTSRSSRGARRSSRCSTTRPAAGVTSPSTTSCSAPPRRRRGARRPPSASSSTARSCAPRPAATARPSTG